LTRENLADSGERRKSFDAPSDDNQIAANWNQIEVAMRQGEACFDLRISARAETTSCWAPAANCNPLERLRELGHEAPNWPKICKHYLHAGILGINLQDPSHNSELPLQAGR
jgi:hypothetical protein